MPLLWRRLLVLLRCHVPWRARVISFVWGRRELQTNDLQRCAPHPSSYYPKPLFLPFARVALCLQSRGRDYLNNMNRPPSTVFHVVMVDAHDV